MEIVRVLGVDPSLRNTGICVVSYNTETLKYSVSDCQVLVNPAKYKGTEAILNMLDMIQDIAIEPCYSGVDTVLVESPPTIFNKAWAASAISSIAHISGGAVAMLGLDKSFLLRPNEWNRCRKKEVTHNKTVAVLGDPSSWHYAAKIKTEKRAEHILDAVSMCFWWIQENHVED